MYETPCITLDLHVQIGGKTRKRSKPSTKRKK